MMGDFSKDMGMLASGLGLSNPNSGNDNQEASSQAAATQAQYQQNAINYLKQENLMPDQARTMLGQLYMGGKGSQTSMDSLKQSPLYQSVLASGAQGQEALARQAATGGGGLRSGTESNAMFNYNNQLHNQALQSSLSGLSGLAGTNYAPQIAQGMSGIGQTLAQGQIAAAQDKIALAQSNQAFNKNLVNTLIGGGEAAMKFSDARLKDKVTYQGKENGHSVYTWVWNDLALEKFGLKGDGCGVLAHEVEVKIPQAIKYVDGYRTVDYDMIGVKEHG